MSGHPNREAGLNLEIQGVRTHVVCHGDGKPLLLLHGVGGPQIWQKMIEPLALNFRVIVLHLPGFGKSDCPKGHLSTMEYSEVVGRVLDALNISSATIVGTSYGAQIAAMFSSENPGRVDSLILIACTGLSGGSRFARNEVVWRLFSTLMKYTLLRSRSLLGLAGHGAFYDLRNRPPDLVENFYSNISDDGKRDAWLNCVKNLSAPPDEFISRLALITSPTLILWGAADRAVPTRDAFEFRRLMSHASLNIIPEAGHSLPLEKPGELCDAITRFYRNEGR